MKKPSDPVSPDCAKECSHPAEGREGSDKRFRNRVDLLPCPISSSNRWKRYVSDTQASMVAFGGATKHTRYCSAYFWWPMTYILGWWRLDARHISAKSYTRGTFEKLCSDSECSFWRIQEWSRACGEIVSWLSIWCRWAVGIQEAVEHGGIQSASIHVKSLLWGRVGQGIGMSVSAESCVSSLTYQQVR